MRFQTLLAIGSAALVAAAAASAPKSEIQSRDTWDGVFKVAKTLGVDIKKGGGSSSKCTKEQVSVTIDDYEFCVTGDDSIEDDRQLKGSPATMLKLRGRTPISTGGGDDE